MPSGSAHGFALGPVLRQVYDEFEEVLARIYHGRVWEQLDATAQCELECLERGFHQWLGEVLRVLLAAIQMRKKQASGNAR